MNIDDHIMNVDYTGSDINILCQSMKQIANVSSLEHQLLQLGEIRRAQPRNRIPALGRIPTGIRNLRTAIRRAPKPIIAITAGTPAVHDIIEPFESILVKPRVQESQHRQSSRKTHIIQQAHNPTKHRRRSTRAIEHPHTALIHHGKVLRLRRNVRERSSAAVEVLRLLTPQLREISTHRRILVLRPGPEIRETSGGEVDPLFREGAVHAPDGGNPGTRGRELRLEVRLVCAVVSDAC